MQIAAKCGRCGYQQTFLAQMSGNGDRSGILTVRGQLLTQLNDAGVHRFGCAQRARARSSAVRLERLKTPSLVPGDEGVNPTAIHPKSFGRLRSGHSLLRDRQHNHLGLRHEPSSRPKRWERCPFSCGNYVLNSHTSRGTIVRGLSPR